MSLAQLSKAETDTLYGMGAVSCSDFIIDLDGMESSSNKYKLNPIALSVPVWIAGFISYKSIPAYRKLEGHAVLKEVLNDLARVCRESTDQTLGDVVQELISK